MLEALEDIRKGNTRTQAFVRRGVPKQTLCSWFADNEDFRFDVEAAEADRDSAIVAWAFEAKDYKWILANFTPDTYAPKPAAVVQSAPKAEDPALERALLIEQGWTPPKGK